MRFSRRTMVKAVALAAMALTTGAAAQGTVSFPKSHAEVVTQTGGRHGFDIELARTPEQLTQGLMYRTAMAANAGMLFDFGVDKPVSMWMHNTLIPLDMLFVARDGRVVGVKQRAVPGSREIISSPGEVRGVLELNGGTIDRLGLKAGDVVHHAMFGND